MQTVTTNANANIPKAPRWITTEAGQWAWHEYVTWRGRATHALSVQDRTQLLDEAEQLWRAQAQSA